MKESIWVQILKIILLSVSAFGYTYPLIEGVGHIIVVSAVIIASIFAALCAKWRIRTLWCVLLSVLFIVVGFGGSYMTLNVFGMDTMRATIQMSRFWYFPGLIFGIVFLTRSLSLRWRTAQLIESTLIVGTLVYLFFAHRDFNLQNPREFSDYLYTNGYDPIEIYRWMGIGLAFLSLPMLFGKTRPGKALYSIIVLAVIALLVANLLAESRLPIHIEDPLGLKSNDDENEDGGKGDEDKDKDDKDNDGSGSNSDSDDDSDQGGGSADNNDDNKNGKGGGKSNDNQGPTGNESPQPVAIAVFYDEFEPSDGIFHFRQNVLSAYDGNHLVSSDYDSDVISSLPASGSAEATPLQNEELHTKISTSMFLLKDHSQPPQVAMGQKIFTIQNPDPKLFVSAYAVESLGMTMDLTRFIGRHSIPAEWSSEQVDHYLQIPDDPRYKALSDIIVRQIDPRFIGDDIVKAMYIKSWLEKNVFYTLKNKHIDPDDPTASFLFGSLRGYCVHIAHSAVYLLRSQGIAARVAIGYAIDNKMRGTGSAVLILGNQAHAWPEIFIDGVGWVTLEIFPENGDEPPREFVDQSLESLFGELARDDKSGGKAQDPTATTFQVPWKTIWFSLLAIVLAALLGCYVRKIVIIVMGHSCNNTKQIYRALRSNIFVWSMYGHPWRKYSTLESFAREEAGPDSATAKLVELGSASKFGAQLGERDVQKARELLPKAQKEAAKHTTLKRKILGWMNPIVRI